jgi:hypothetical protein
MANRATLVNKDTVDYSEQDVDSGCLAINYSIAVLWFALYTCNDLRYLEHQAADTGEHFKIPYLSTTTSQARENLRKRIPVLSKHLSAIGKEAMKELERILSNWAKPFVVLDTWEIWMMEVEGFDEFLVESINNIEEGNLFPLTEQAFIREGEEEVHQYIGFEWG